MLMMRLTAASARPLIERLLDRVAKARLYLAAEPPPRLIKQHAHVNRSQVHLRVAHIPTFCKCDPREIEVEGGTVEVEGGADFVQPIEAGIN